MEYQDNINELINKYLEGKTSFDEENQIAMYFNENTNISEEHLAVKMMFDYYKYEKSQSSKLKVDNIINKNNANRKYFIIRTLSIAASILLLVALLVFKSQKPNKQVYAYINGKAITDKRIALIETQKALMTVSTNFNEGTQNLSYLQKINKAKEILQSRTTE